MRTALSEISTPNASFAEDVAAYAAAGFDGIGIWEFKLPDDDATNVALLRDTGLAVANCVPAVPTILPLLLPGMEGPPDVAERISALCGSMRRLAAYEPESVLVITGPVGALAPAEARRLVVEGLGEIAGAARDAGVRLGLEPIHPAQDDTVSFVHSVGDAVALLDEAGLDDVGVMVDTYNLWHEDPVAIAAVAERVTGLHVADESADVGVEGRVLPGEGGAHAATVVAALRDAGWNGSLDVEIFSTPDRFWGLPLDDAARRAQAAASALLSTP